MQSEANAIDADTVVAALKRVGRVLPDLTFDITDVAVAPGRARPPPSPLRRLCQHQRRGPPYPTAAPHR
jgi:hypothetical protein